MIFTTEQQKQLARATAELEYEKTPPAIPIEDGVAVWVQEAHGYLIAQVGERMWWTNDLPLVAPEVLTPQALRWRTERLTRCKGKGRCYPWCTGKRSIKVVVPDQEVEDEDA